MKTLDVNVAPYKYCNYNIGSDNNDYTLMCYDEPHVYNCMILIYFILIKRFARLSIGFSKCCALCWVTVQI